MAFRTLTGDAERLFTQTLDSVRPVTEADAASIRPLRLVLVTAAQGDTVEGLGRRMAVADRAVERFLALNGLERGDPLQPGERYKLIAE